MYPAYGTTQYNNEFLQAANRYGIDLTGAHMPVTGPPMNAHSMVDLHRAKQKQKARQQSSGMQLPGPAQPRVEEDHDIGDGLEEDCFALVSTEALEKQGLRPHPDKIAEAAALSSVPLPAGTYKMCLPAQIVQGKHCSLLTY